MADDIENNAHVSQVAPVCAYDIVKATQYGEFERCRQLIDDGYDVNTRDNIDVTLLHWASINNRCQLASFYLSRGAEVDAVGGDLKSTPLHWAIRQGHLSMVVLLMHHGAEPCIADVEGFACLHVAAQCGFSNIVAYMLARGQGRNVSHGACSVDALDKNGMTALMWSCHRCTGMDPTRLLVTFGADVNRCDLVYGNTALHWAVIASNVTAVQTLLRAGAHTHVHNVQGETAYSLACRRPVKWMGVEYLNMLRDNSAQEPARHRYWLKTIASRVKTNQCVHRCVVVLAPWLLFLLVGSVFCLNTDALIKLALLVLLYIGVFYCGQLTLSSRTFNQLPVSVYLATKCWFVLSWAFVLRPYVEAAWSVLFVGGVSMLCWTFCKCWLGDPGLLAASHQQKCQTIVELAESGGFNMSRFCSTCLVRRPVRSKHCASCDRCVAKFDHHCPWINNCVGAGNHRYFVYYLLCVVVMCLLYTQCCLLYFQHACRVQLSESGVVSGVFLMADCDTWVLWTVLNAIVHAAWVTALSACQLYQICWLAMTTNERINAARYSHFSSDSASPFDRGVLGNFADFFHCGPLPCAPAPRRVSWAHVFSMDQWKGATGAG